MDFSWVRFKMVAGGIAEALTPVNGKKAGTLFSTDLKSV